MLHLSLSSASTFYILIFYFYLLIFSSFSKIFSILFSNSLTHTSAGFILVLVLPGVAFFRLLYSSYTVFSCTSFMISNLGHIFSIPSFVSLTYLFGKCKMLVSFVLISTSFGSFPACSFHLEAVTPIAHLVLPAASLFSPGRQDVEREAGLLSAGAADSATVGGGGETPGPSSPVSHFWLQIPP